MEHQYWHRRVELAKLTNAPSYGVGAFINGNILLIGEQAADPSHNPEAPEQPFCSSKGCSGWLNKLLSSECIPEEKIFWINALYNDGSPVNVGQVVSDLNPSAIIALGSVAKRACKEANVNFIGEYHPQYWKRFRAKQPYPLLNTLKFLVTLVPSRSELINKCTDG